ncbi:MAG: TrbI/VirB10 family protein [Alphaproteobacteria bacterium]|nr:TrbI/VirB10 family protein [Alphaproteobacteria bacterium]
MANNDLDNENFEPDFDQAVDFDEFGGDRNGSSVANTITGSPVVKLALVGVAILVLVGVIALFGGDDKVVPNSRVGGGAADLKEAPGTNSVTETMRGALEDDNQQKLEEALKTGTSAIPTPIDPPKVLLGVPENEAGGEDPLVRWKRLQEERLRLQREQEEFTTQAQEDPQKAERVSGLREAMMNQISNIMGEKTIAQMQNMKIYDLSMMEKASSQNNFTGIQNAGLAGSSQDGQSTPLVPLKVIVPAGDILYSQLLMEANSDVPGPIVALLVSGPFSGSRVLGSFQRQEEYLTMRFTTLIGKDGNSIPIDALAVDPDTTLGAMATDVDHRYWQRIILPAAASFIEGMGSAIAENGTTTVTVSGSDTAIAEEDNNLDTKQEISKAAAEAASKVGELLDDQSDVEILVRVRAGTPMGLLFTKPITDQDIDASKYAPQQQASQANQQNGAMFMGQPQNGMVYNPAQLLQQGLNNQMLMQQTGYVPIQQTPATSGAQ